MGCAGTPAASMSNVASKSARSVASPGGGPGSGSGIVCERNVPLAAGGALGMKADAVVDEKSQLVAMKPVVVPKAPPSPNPRDPGNCEIAVNAGWDPTTPKPTMSSWKTPVAGTCAAPETNSAREVDAGKMAATVQHATRRAVRWLAEDLIVSAPQR